MTGLPNLLILLHVAYARFGSSVHGHLFIARRPNRLGLCVKRNLAVRISGHFTTGENVGQHDTAGETLDNRNPKP